ncbi:MAG: GntR family transcriptional regulator [Synergistaceae bacterium]|nr:GntR family transcriptional regulator [Synergistaceae bacterium]
MTPYPPFAVKKEQSLSGTIYEKIKDKIIIGEYPPNTPLLERSLAEDFGVSRTPVREALKRLLMDDLITWEERRMALVSTINEKDVRELFVMRQMIEPFAIRRTFSVGEPKLLAGFLAPIINEMKELKNDHVGLMKKDMDFHSTIINSLQIQMLSQMWQNISDKMTRIAIYSIHAKRKPESIIEEHNKVIDALWNCKLEDALACIENHHANILTAYKIKHDDYM